MATIAAHPTKLVTRLNAQIVMLIAEFLLGMIVNLIGTPSSSAAKIAFRVTLPLHVLLGLGLVVNAVLIIRLAATIGDKTKATSRAGAAMILAAFIFGALTMGAPLANLWSFAMAAAFIGAFITYGRLYIHQAHIA
jgi:hypothetical protein